jgi:hypothetical protein
MWICDRTAVDCLEQGWRPHLQEEEEGEQYSLFQPSPEELASAEELRTQAEDLLFRTFYRALKALANQMRSPFK